MLERLSNPVQLQNAFERIHAIIQAHGEWLCVNEGLGAPTTHKRTEIDLRLTHSRLVFSHWSDRGAMVWRVTGWEWTGEKLLLDVARRIGRERVVIELIPRISTASIDETIRSTRMNECLRIARLASKATAVAKVERAALSIGARKGQPGRYARILLRVGRERIAVTGPVVEMEPSGIDSFLSSALLWFNRASEIGSVSIRELWLVVSCECVEPLMQRYALLRDDLQRVIRVFELPASDDGLVEASRITRDDLWNTPVEKLGTPSNRELSDWGRRLIELAPETIDVVRSRYGETFRYHGLAFARVRRVMDEERIWFGVEGLRRRALDDLSLQHWTTLVHELTIHRRTDSADKRHALYRALAESWLESMLRRDIARLDPGLVVAPIHAQFRTTRLASAAARPVDLLARRRDGQLVVIELKTSEDRDHVLQGADYWRRVEAHRRHGTIQRARLFGDEPIADLSPLVYLVAPTLSFHRAFYTLARAIHPAVEMYRFDINEDWRSGVKVMRRLRVN